MDKMQMLDSVKSYLSQFGAIDVRIIKAMDEVDRINFIEEEYKNEAYEDTAMPIGLGQTISQPSTVGRMLSLLELKKGDKVLEIGTGSGWNAVLIDYIIGKNGMVVTTEIIEELIRKSKNVLKRLNIKDVQILREDFRNLKEKFDKIIFTAGIVSDQEHIIKEFIKQHLNPNGIAICPNREGPLIIFKKNEKMKKFFTEESYIFVPLVL
ncbi:MAG: protein-L-isoaspartate O-methyltransferase family protein [Nanoarchaeota archaeon]